MLRLLPAPTEGSTAANAVASWAEVALVSLSASEFVRASADVVVAG